MNPTSPAVASLLLLAGTMTACGDAPLRADTATAEVALDPGLAAETGEADAAQPDAPDVSAPDAPDAYAPDVPEVSLPDAPDVPPPDAPDVAFPDAPDVFDDPPPPDVAPDPGPAPDLPPDIAPAHDENEELWPGVTVRMVALHFAPIWYQDTADNGPDGLGAKADVPTLIDYDGDLQHDNNWNNLPATPIQPWIYYALVATDSHYFLTYGHYHPRDWEQLCTGLFTECHEGDMESLRIVVRRDDTGYGVVELVRTHGHGVNSYWTVSPDVSAGAEGLDGELDFEDDAGGIAAVSDAQHSHVRIFAQAKGHGLAPCWAQNEIIKPFGFTNVECPDDAGHSFPGGDGIKLVPQEGQPVDYAPGMEDAGQPVGYGLVSVAASMWLWRDHIGPDALFEPDQAFQYSGVRGPPFAIDELIGAEFRAEQFTVDNSGNAPWSQGMAGANQGDVFFDPAWAFAGAFGFPAPWSTDYTYHPYLPDVVP